MKRLPTLALLFIITIVAPIFISTATAGIVSAPELKRVSYQSASTGKERDFYVYLPEGYVQGKNWPVLMVLHGNGERGNGKDELDWVLVNGPLGEAWGQQRHLPFVIIAPQLPMFNQGEAGFIKNRSKDRIHYPRPEGPYPYRPNYNGKDKMDGQLSDPNFPFGLDGTAEGWSMIENELLLMIDRVVADFKGDPSRVYLTGLSTGGFGTWYMAGKHPDRFAAIAPVAGFCHPDLVEPIAKAKLPMWVFTGGRDPYFKVKFFYPSMNKFEELGLTDVRFTVHEDMGHNSWDRVYAGKDLYDWLLTKQKSAPTK